MASSCARKSVLLRIFSGCVIASPAVKATSFTGGAVSCRERPTGRSGCVTTRATSWPAASKACSVGAANCGVPQKTSLTDLPCAFALHLADPAQGQVALQTAHAKDKQHSVQVVNLVLKTTRKQRFAVHLKPLSLLILGAHAHLGRPHYLLVDVRETEAAFFFVLLAFA